MSGAEVRNLVAPAPQHNADASDAELRNSVAPAPADASPPEAVVAGLRNPAAAAPQHKADISAPEVPVAAAPQPDVDADLALVSTEQPQRLSTWTLSQQDKDTIDAANVVTDVPTKLRNKVYAAIARAITQAKAEQIYMPPAVIARYDEAAANRGLLAARFPCLFSIYLIV